MNDLIKLPHLHDVWVRKSMIAFVQADKKKKIVQVCLIGEHEPFEIKCPTKNEYDTTIQMLVSN